MEKARQRRVLEHSKQLGADRPPRTRELDSKKQFSTDFRLPYSHGSKASINSTKTKTTTGWFRLNAQNCVPGNSSRRFFELDHEILHTYSGRQYLKLEEGGVLFRVSLSRYPGFDPPPGSSTPAGTPNNRPPRQKIKKKTLFEF